MNLHLPLHSPATAEPAEPAARAGHPLVAVTFPLGAEDRDVLQQLLGPDAVVADSRVVEHPDLVLVTPCSVQAMTKLRHQFADATIVVTDTTRTTAPLATGPVRRLLDAGADEYTSGRWLDPEVLGATA